MPTDDKEDVLNPAYWDLRLVKAAARGEIHRSIFMGTPDAMAEKQEAQEAALAFGTWYGGGVSVLDLGCGYGRLLDMLQARYGRVPPPGRYLGVDLSPNLVDAARERWPTHWFQAGDLRTFVPDHPLYLGGGRFDVGVLLWVRQPVLANAGAAAWEAIEANASRYCRRLIVVD